MENVIIIGSGPAGLTAAIYTARANLNPLIFEGFQYGGQLMNTTDIENFPGFPEGIVGPDLMNDMREQAKRFQAQLVQKNVEAADLSQRPFKVTVDGEVHEAKAVILATGANARMCPVGVSWGFRPVSELVASGARHLIDHPSELLNLL